MQANNNEIEIEYSGIVCDHCDFRDDAVTFEQYPEYLNKPCPSCGHSLLTQEDYDKCLAMYKAAKLINNVRKYTKVSFWKDKVKNMAKKIHDIL